MIGRTFASEICHGGPKCFAALESRHGGGDRQCERFRSAALVTHWTTAQIRGDNFLIQPASPNRLTLPVRVWFAMRQSALFEILTSRVRSRHFPGNPWRAQVPLHRRGSAKNSQRGGTTSDDGSLLKETYGDRLFLVYAAEPSLTSTQPEPEETRRCSNVACRACAALRPGLSFAKLFSNSSISAGGFSIARRKKATATPAAIASSAN